MIINVELFGKAERCLVFRNSSNIDIESIKLKNFQLNEVVSSINLVQVDESEKLFVKVFPSKYGHNPSKKLNFIFREIISERLLFTAHSLREYRGIKKLSKIGIRTPKVYAAGYFITSMNRLNGIIIYEKLENVITIEELMLQDGSKDLKQHVMKQIKLDYHKMTKSYIHFRDFHMSNILVDLKDKNLYWIDSNVYRISRVFK